MTLSSRVLPSMLFLVLPFVVSPSISLDPVNPAKILFLAAVIANFSIHYIFSLSKLRFSERNIFLFLMLVIIAFWVSIGFFVDTNISQHMFGNVGRGFSWLTVCLSLLLFLILADKVKKDGREILQIIPKLLLTVNALQLSIIALQKYAKILVYWDTESQPIPVSTLGNPNYVSALLGISSIGCFYLFSKVSLVYKLPLGFQLLLNIYFLNELNSVQGLLMFIFNLLAFLVIANNNILIRLGIVTVRKFLIASAIMTFSLIVFFFSTFEFWISRLNLVSRADYWYASIRGIFMHPIFGNGFGTFGEKLPSLRTTNMIERNYFSDSPHNFFLEMGFSVGIPVMLLLIIAWIMGLVRVIKLLIVDPDKIDLLVLFAGYTNSTFQLMISPIEITLLSWSLFWLCLTLFYKSKELKVVESTGSVSIRRVISSIESKSLSWTQNIVFPLTAIILVVLSWLPFSKDAQFRRAIENGDGRRMYEISTNFPVDQNRYRYTIGVLKDNGYLELARDLATQYVLDFPKSESARNLKDSLKNN